MSFELQEGIYYRKKPQIGNSFCVISLRAENSSKIEEIGSTIALIWNCLLRLKNGIIPDLDIDARHRKNGNLTVLLAYGSRVFEIPASQKTKPASFSDKWTFKQPNTRGGGPILEGSDIVYSAGVIENHLLEDHILFQFIADNGFYTNRAAVEVWKQLRLIRKRKGIAPLRITGLYSGFQRQDYRNWLGFHDGVSNLKSYERPKVILIDSRNLSSSDKWISSGTYLGFLRIDIDLEKWEDIDIFEQEKIIGRDKLTGCPLVRIDKNGKPIKDNRCPVRGTSEVIDPGNEIFRDHPPYGIRSDDKVLQFSHIGSTRPIDRIPLGDRRSFRIYRQGFEYLVSSEVTRSLIPGLNFVSFQSSPESLFRSLTYNPTVKLAGISPLPNLNKFMNVCAAGIFLVPPITRDEPFPGARIFFRPRELSKISTLKTQSRIT
jgi:deferrochelatase/peroxidase EfeB